MNIVTKRLSRDIFNIWGKFQCFAYFVILSQWTKKTQSNGALFSSTWQRKKTSNNLGNSGSNNYIAKSGKVP